MSEQAVHANVIPTDTYTSYNLSIDGEQLMSKGKNGTKKDKKKPSKTMKEKKQAKREKKEKKKNPSIADS